MVDYFTKHHPPPHHREIHAAYLHMTNVLLKIYHKVVQEWSKAVLTPNHMVVIMPNHIVVQGWSIFLRTDGHTKPTTVT